MVLEGAPLYCDVTSCDVPAEYCDVISLSWRLLNVVSLGTAGFYCREKYSYVVYLNLI